MRTGAILLYVIIIIIIIIIIIVVVVVISSIVRDAIIFVVYCFLTDSHTRQDGTIGLPRQVY